MTEFSIELKIRTGEAGQGRYATTEAHGRNDSNHDRLGDMAEVLSDLVAEVIGSNNYAPDVMEVLARALRELENEHHGDLSEGNELQVAAAAYVLRCERERENSRED